MMGGLLLTFVILSPVDGIRLDRLSDAVRHYEMTGRNQTQEGIYLAAVAEEEIIKQRTAAYILDKAQDLHAEVDVKVTLADGTPPVPESVMVEGKISPYSKTRLQKIIEDDLGITKEQQIWIGWN